LQQMIKLRPLGHVHDRLVPALQAAREAELDGAPAVEACSTCGRVGWRAVARRPVAGLDDLAAAAFAATEPLVPVTRPQPVQADSVLGRGRVP
jgi:hypothetical protein